MNTAPKLTVMSDSRFAQAPATPAIEVLSAEKIYSNGTRALLPVNLTINQGEFVTLLGPSGCGKSTLLKMVAGLVEPSDGKLMLWRRDSREKAQLPLSFVFQEATLMPWSSVHSNVTAADNSDCLAVADGGIIFGQICLHQIDSCQVFICRKYTVCLFSRNTHELRKSGSGADKYCIISFFL